jgi:hypothetical protein
MMESDNKNREKHLFVLPPLAEPGPHLRGAHIFANWVIPQLVMAGAYPGAKKGCAHEEEIHEKIITQVVEAGTCTCALCAMYSTT